MKAHRRCFSNPMNHAARPGLTASAPTKPKPLLPCAIVAAIVLVAVAALPGSAQVSATIHGTTTYAGDMSCLYSSSGFNADLTPVVINGQQPVVWVSTISTQGTLTFNPDGTGTAQIHELGVTLFPGNPPRSNASSDDAVFSFSYDVTAATNPRTLTIQAGSVQGTILTGPLANDTFTVVNLPMLSGPIAPNGTVVLLGAAPAVETITLTDPNGQTSSNSRICQRSRTLTPLTWFVW